MHDAAQVRIGQGPGDLLEELGDLTWRQRSARAHPLAERLALHVGHREPDQVADRVHVVDRDDVRVRELGRHLRLAEEALAQRGLPGHVGRQQLDRDETVQLDVARQKDDAHAAAPQLTLQRVAADHRLLEGEELGRDGVRHDLS